RVLIGFIFAVITAIPLAILCGYSRHLSGFIKPFVELLRPIPPIAWIPIAILLFGLGDQSSYFIVFLGAFFPIFTNSYFGVISLPVIYKNVAKSFEIKKSVFIVRILFCFALPYIFTGLKIGIGMAWMSLIAAELIGAQSGLGYFIQMNRLLLRIDNVVLGMVLIGLIGYILTKFLTVLEQVAMPWLPKNKS
ncbi:MAG: ABC transporter permease subunit, partial [Patescibacteria group bacterium]